MAVLTSADGRQNWVSPAAPTPRAPLRRGGSRPAFIRPQMAGPHEESSAKQTGVANDFSMSGGTYPRRQRVPIPQQGHWRSIALCCRAVNGSGHGDARKRARQSFRPFARQQLARKPKVTDLDEARRQDVKEEAANKLDRFN